MDSELYEHHLSSPRGRGKVPGEGSTGVAGTRACGDVIRFGLTLDTRIRMIRGSSLVPISSLSSDDPVRRQFGMLHGMSSMLLIGQVVAAAAVVASRE